MMAALPGNASGITGLAGDKLAQLLDEYKNATRQLEAIGFRVGKMTIGMGLLCCPRCIRL